MFGTPNIQFTPHMYTLICVSPFIEKLIKDVICSSSSSSASLAQRQIQEQQYQTSSMAAAAATPSWLDLKLTLQVPAH
jgi:hypothetical protein